MMKRTLAAAFAILSPLTAVAGGFDMVADPVAIAPAPVAVSSPDLVFRIGGGLAYGSSYYGSDSEELTPSGSFNFQFLRGPGGLAFGSESGASRYGFAPRGSFRVIGKRSAADDPELAGLRDVPLSVEVGFGLGYASRNFEAFADVRYGAIGHHSFVGELGADVVMRPSDRLTLTAGPRMVLGSNRFNDTYFGVTPAEALASAGTLKDYNPGSGAVSVGVELGASYALNDRWSLDGALRYDRFRGDARQSPIVAQGSDTDVRLTIGVSRLISLDF